MNNYDCALNLFTDVSIGAHYTGRPFRQGSYIYATDRISMIRVKSDLTNEEYNEIKSPNSEQVFRRESNRNKVYTLDGLKALFALIPEVGFEECDACDGRGRVDFEFEYDGDTYYKSGDCPICEGSGQKELLIKEKDFRYGVMFEPDSYPIKQKYLEILYNTMNTLGINSALLVYSDSIFYKFQLSKDIDIMFCGYIPKPGYEDYVVCYENLKETK